MYDFLLSWKFFIFISVVSAIQAFILNDKFSWSISLLFATAACYKGVFYLKNFGQTSRWLDKLFCLFFAFIIIASSIFGFMEVVKVSSSDSMNVFYIVGYILSVLGLCFGVVMTAVGLFSQPVIASDFLRKIFSSEEGNIDIF